MYESTFWVRSGQGTGTSDTTFYTEWMAFLDGLQIQGHNPILLLVG